MGYIEIGVLFYLGVLAAIAVKSRKKVPGSRSKLSR